MPINISLKKSLNIKFVKNHVFFTDKDFKIKELNKFPISKFSSFINKSISSSELSHKNFLSLDINPLQKVILIKIKNNQSSLDVEKIGAEFFTYLKTNLYLNTTYYEENIRNISSKNKFFF